MLLFLLYSILEMSYRVQSTLRYKRLHKSVKVKMWRSLTVILEVTYHKLPSYAISRDREEAKCTRKVEIRTTFCLDANIFPVPNYSLHKDLLHYLLLASIIYLYNLCSKFSFFLPLKIA